MSGKFLDIASPLEQIGINGGILVETNKDGISIMILLLGQKRSEIVERSCFDLIIIVRDFALDFELYARERDRCQGSRDVGALDSQDRSGKKKCFIVNYS